MNARVVLGADSMPLEEALDGWYGAQPWVKGMTWEARRWKVTEACKRYAKSGLLFGIPNIDHGELPQQWKGLALCIAEELLVSCPQDGGKAVALGVILQAERYALHITEDAWKQTKVAWLMGDQNRAWGDVFKEQLPASVRRFSAKLTPGAVYSVP